MLATVASGHWPTRMFAKITVEFVPGEIAKVEVGIPGRGRKLANVQSVSWHCKFQGGVASGIMKMDPTSDPEMTCVAVREEGWVWIEICAPYGSGVVDVCAQEPTKRNKKAKIKIKRREKAMKIRWNSVWMQWI